MPLQLKIAKTIDEQNKKKDDEDFKAEQLKQGFWGNLNSENSAAVLEGSAARNRSYKVVSLLQKRLEQLQNLKPLVLEYI